MKRGKIIQCSSKGYWYENYVGREFEIDENFNEYNAVRLVQDSYESIIGYKTTVNGLVLNRDFELLPFIDNKQLSFDDAIIIRDLVYQSKNIQEFIDLFNQAGYELKRYNLIKKT